jgi:SAM-dependent methyltransferase
MSHALAIAAEAPSSFEHVLCYACGSTKSQKLLDAEDDLTGRPGRFTFVRCLECGLAYQNPRLTIDRIADYYDDQYIAHRRKRDWGVLTPLVERAMNKLDTDKDRLAARYLTLTASSRVLDVGCGAGTFLHRLRTLYHADVTGVDFKDLSSSPWLEAATFHHGTFDEAPIAADRFDLVTMWHFLEHDYDPLLSLRTARRVMKRRGRLIVEVPRLDSCTFAWFGDRWPGLQAPQHTVLFDRDSLLGLVKQAGLEVVDYLPFGAFPAYFYVFTGVAFRMLKGRGLDLDRALIPYFLGRLLLSPMLVFEHRLNLAMQTVICRRPS